MAQQLGQIRFIGKVGNMVGFTNSASLKKDAVFVRTAPDEVFNPQSNGQARQRSRLKPALNFYSAFAPVLSCAYYPGRNENKNKRYFMRRAMKEPVMSDVMMSENLLPFLPYQVSRGYLGLDALCQKVGEYRFSEHVNVMLFGIKYSYVVEGDYPISQISKILLDDNPELSNGMQITILCIAYLSEDTLTRRAITLSFVLDRDNNVTIWDDIPGSRDISIDGVQLDGETGPYYMSVHLAGIGWEIGSAAVIISAKKNKSWDYTNSFMHLTEESEILRAQRARATRPSYQPSHHPR